MMLHTIAHLVHSFYLLQSSKTIECSRVVYCCSQSIFIYFKMIHCNSVKYYSFIKMIASCHFYRKTFKGLPNGIVDNHKDSYDIFINMNLPALITRKMSLSFQIKLSFSSLKLPSFSYSLYNNSLVYIRLIYRQFYLYTYHVSCFESKLLQFHFYISTQNV